VQAAEPEARLSIVGRNPPEDLRRRVASLAGVELHANVPDVRPYLAQCGLVVVPLRIGGGSRLKILEALASAVAVVSTRIGAEGLRLQPDRHLTVAEDIDQLSQALVRAIRTPQAMQAQALRGREQVLRHYDWDILADQMEQIWLKSAAGGERRGLSPPSFPPG
jgi:glycosyltransferase involved in cell wall biosynthesis